LFYEFYLSGGNCCLREVVLHILLEIEVGKLVTLTKLKELGKLGIRKNAALERGIEAAVALYISRDKLGHISLALLALGR
jgi:hypothetical protein